MPRRSGAVAGTLRLPKLPRLDKPPTFTRGPRELQRALSPLRQRQYPPPPAWWGTAPETEWAVWWTLTYPLKKQPEVDFTYQHSGFLGGRQAFGGTVLDFVMLDGSDIAINPLGEHWHFGLGTGRQAIDLAQRAALLSQYGLTLIFIEERHCLENPFFYVSEALRGRDHSRVAEKIR